MLGILAAVAAPPARVAVMPFDNLSQGGAHAWVSDAFAEAILANLGAAGEEVASIAERDRKRQERGLASSAPLTRSMVIELGQSLGARRAIVGSYRVVDDRLEVGVRVLDVETGSLVGVVQDEGRFSDLLHVQNQVSKNILRLASNDVPESFLVSARRRRAIPKAAYENYVKALSAESEAQQALLEEALAQAPTYSEAKLLLGESFRRAGKARQAIDVFSSLPPADPSYRSAYFAAGLSFLEIGEEEGAAQIFGALAEREGAAAFYNNLGVARFRDGRIDEALEALKCAVEADPKDFTSLFNLGWMSWRSGKGADAYRRLKEGIRLNPDDGEAHFLFAAAAAAQALPEEASSARARAVALSKRFEALDASTIRGLERVTQALPTSAVLASDTVEGTLADRVRYHMERARQNAVAGRREEAIRELERAVYLSPYSDEARLELARLYKEAGNLPKAAGEARVVLWNGDNVDAHVLLAEVLLTMGQLDEARTHIEAAAAIEPSRPQLSALREKLHGVKP